MMQQVDSCRVGQKKKETSSMKTRVTKGDPDGNHSSQGFVNPTCAISPARSKASCSADPDMVM